jgi:heat shock protein HspQ
VHGCVAVPCPVVPPDRAGPGIPPAHAACDATVTLPSLTSARPRGHYDADMTLQTRAFPSMDKIPTAKFRIGQIVRHRVYPFRGVVFDVDPTFNNTEEWWLAIPEDIRPRKDQPFYHLYAENAESEYVAYVSEQNLVPDESGEPLRHPQIEEAFVEDDNGQLRAREQNLN